MPPGPGSLELDSGISSTPYVMVIPPWHSLVELCNDIFPAADIVAIETGFSFLDLGGGISFTLGTVVTLPWHGLVGLGIVFSSTPIVMVIPL